MSKSPQRFPTTSRTLIDGLQAPDQQTREVSLVRFCTQYYAALYGYARNLGLREADAKDRVQDFFVEVVRDDLLTKFDQTRGTHLSSWLMTCFKNQVLSHEVTQNSIKRGRGYQWVPLNEEDAEHSFKAAHLAQLEPAPTFDLTLARGIWQAARGQLLERHQSKGADQGGLVADLLPFTILERWPPPPMPTQEEIAARHHTTPTRLKAFFNRTLRSQARRYFNSEALSAAPGIDPTELDHLWHLLICHGEA